MIQSEGLAAAQDGRSPMLADIQRAGARSRQSKSTSPQTGDPASVAIRRSRPPDRAGRGDAGQCAEPGTDRAVGVHRARRTTSPPRCARWSMAHRIHSSPATCGSSGRRWEVPLALVGAARVASEQLFAPASWKEWVMVGSPFLSCLTALQDRLQTASPLRRQGGRGTDRSF